MKIIISLLCIISDAYKSKLSPPKNSVVLQEDQFSFWRDKLKEKCTKREYEKREQIIDVEINEEKPILMIQWTFRNSESHKF